MNKYIVIDVMNSSGSRHCSEFLAPKLSRLGLSPQERLGLLKYCERIERRGLPPLLNLQHLGISAGVGSRFLAGVLRSPEAFYRTYEIPKRRGGNRTISAPRPYLMHTQRWILENILAHLPIHPSATGFHPGGGIVANAKPHLINEYLLKMDVQDFFGTITREMAEEVFVTVGYSGEIGYILSQLVTLNGRLPQGAPTSPAISNIVMMAFDTAISDYCSRKNLVYTRYADDIAVSGMSVGTAQIDTIGAELLVNGFLAATDKTLIAKKGQKKIVTGISISSGLGKLPRRQRRRLRQELHFVEKFGADEHAKHIGYPDPIYQQRLLGTFAHWLHVEPENSTARRGVSLLKKRQVRKAPFTKDD